MFKQIGNQSDRPALLAIVKARSVYGVTAFYPANEVAQGFADIAGTKTLTLETLRTMKRIGVELQLDAAATIDALRA